MMELHELKSVACCDPDNASVYRVEVDLTDVNGERYTTDYVSRADDTFGLAPTVRAAIDQWIADGKTVAPYVPPTTEEIRAAMPPLTARQLRLGLVDNGFTPSQVETAISNITDPTEREKAQIEWEYATEYRRDHLLIAQIGTALSLSDEQVDAMWTEARAL